MNKLLHKTTAIIVICAVYAVAANPGLGITSHPSAFQTSTTFVVNNSTFNVRDFGAVGNGIVDDTAAIQKALTTCAMSDFGGSVYFPTGNYVVSSALQIAIRSGGPAIQLVGDGWSSIVSWAFDGHLFVWSGDVATHITIMHLRIRAAVKVSPASAAFSFSVRFHNNHFTLLLRFRSG